jgi:hypothetical protein
MIGRRDEHRSEEMGCGFPAHGSSAGRSQSDATSISASLGDLCDELSLNIEGSTSPKEIGRTRGAVRIRLPNGAVSR